MNTGIVVQVIGPVVDVKFADGQLPAMRNAVTTEVNGKTLVMEVAQHVGDNVARLISMNSTDGLARGAA